jgi:hypothetical protein
MLEKVIAFFFVAIVQCVGIIRIFLQGITIIVVL